MQVEHNHSREIARPSADVQSLQNQVAQPHRLKIAIKY